MLKEIGSTFWLDPNVEYNITNRTIRLLEHEDYSDIILLSSGRAAESIVLETIEERNPSINKVAIIPAFTCSTVINPFHKFEYEVHTYGIDNKLRADVKKIAELIEETKAGIVLFHRYFGFDTCVEWENLIEKYSALGVVFIEDKTQCLYSKLSNLKVDYTIGSLRKWAGLPDGGFALCKQGDFSHKPNICNETMIKLKVKASYLKYEYMFNEADTKDEFRKLYSEAADLLSKESHYYKISPVSIAVQEKINIEELELQRRENYRLVYNSLKDMGNIVILTPKLEENIVPLYIALLVDNREELQKELSEHQIYAPIIWPYEDKSLDINEETLNIYKKILCLPIDQRYKEDDMNRAIECIRRYYEN